jgi:hypothetical protein
MKNYAHVSMCVKVSPDIRIDSYICGNFFSRAIVIQGSSVTFAHPSRKRDAGGEIEGSNWKGSEIQAKALEAVRPDTLPFMQNGLISFVQALHN